jgi:hypothetical protein
MRATARHATFILFPATFANLAPRTLIIVLAICCRAGDRSLPIIVRGDLIRRGRLDRLLLIGARGEREQQSKHQTTHEHLRAIRSAGRAPGGFVPVSIEVSGSAYSSMRMDQTVITDSMS